MEPFSLSRSAIEEHVRCPRCFYLNIRRGVPKVKTFPFTLNNAVDALLKKEFDQHREKKSKHPIAVKYQIDAIPLAYPDIEQWQNKNDGLNFIHAESNFRVCGKLDDVWVNTKGELIVVDYKATSTEKEITLEADYRQSYKRQLEIYAWLLKGMGFPVHSKGYFVYTNALTTPEAFNDRLEFKTTLLEHTLNDSWIAPKLMEIRTCLTNDQTPLPTADCSLCNWVNAVASF